MLEPFLPSEIKTLLLQLTGAVEYLHSNWIIHRDIKTSNLLMNNRGQIKVADFGMARYYGDPPPKLTQLVVTLWYRAPELLLGAEKYGPEIDLWSVGCIFGELLRKEPLLQGKNEVEQLTKVSPPSNSTIKSLSAFCSQLKSPIPLPHPRYSNSAESLPKNHGPASNVSPMPNPSDSHVAQLPPAPSSAPSSPFRPPPDLNFSHPFYPSTRPNGRPRLRYSPTLISKKIQNQSLPPCSQHFHPRPGRRSVKG